MKPVMTHSPTKSSRTQDVTQPLRADLATLDHFRSMNELNHDSLPISATHHHHKHHSPILALIAPIHSDN
jgi:hypothetical protein